MGARFDIEQIRAGRADDPQIIGGDTVVVGYSGSKGFWRDVRETAPLLNLFYLIR
jgi:polysaccharide export outer membrane protein